MSTSTATAYEYNVAGHLSFGAPKCEKAQKSSGFWANRTYRLCIKDNVLIDPACGSGNFLTETYLSLRKLENRVLYELESGQIKIGSIEDERIGKRISLKPKHSAVSETTFQLCAICVPQQESYLLCRWVFLL